MNLKRLWYIITVLMIFGVVFYLGYLMGNREYVNNQPDDIVLIGPNLSQQNSFSDMIIKDIYGSKNSKDIAVFGELYYKIVGDKTELFVRLHNAPLEVRQTQNNLRKSIPQTLNIQSAERTPDGLKYNYTNIGQITFNEPQNDTMSAEFTTIVDFPLTAINSSVERLVFTGVEEGDENLFIYPDPNLPAYERNLPAPYFWVVL